MKKEMKKLYEGMYILNASLSEDALKKALQRITKTIETHEGEIQKVHEMGRKKLAYEINRSRQGQYFLFYFSIVPKLMSEVWQGFQLNEDLIRFMTIRTNHIPETLEFKPLIET